VPFAILSSDDVKSARHRPVSYNENSAQSTGLIIPEAWTIMEKFIRGEALIS
jgi:hypothetical protein